MATGYHEPAPAPVKVSVQIEDVVVEDRDGNYFAVITGNLPDSCSAIDGVDQSARGNTVSLTVVASRPGDLLCAQALTPFSEEVQLDTEDLEAGEYTVNVNDELSLNFTIS